MEYLPNPVNCDEYDEHTFGIMNTPKNPVTIHQVPVKKELTVYIIF